MVNTSPFLGRLRVAPSGPKSRVFVNGSFQWVPYALRQLHNGQSEQSTTMLALPSLIMGSIRALPSVEGATVSAQ